jgi:hypothetical protein
MNEGWEFLGVRGDDCAVQHIVQPHFGNKLEVPILECDTLNNSSVKLASYQRAK